MSDDVVQAVGPERAAALLLELWAIEGTLSPLPSYEDENHRVKSDAGEFVFRISHPRTTRSSLETQNRAMQAVAAALPGRCPSVVSSRNDREFEEISSYGETRLCRLLRFIPGRTWAEARPHPLGRHRQLGGFLTRLDEVLARVPTDGASGFFEWDLLNAEEVVGRNLHELPPGPRRDLIESAHADFRDRCGPMLAELPRAFIHNDANDQNLLVSETDESIAGIIDFEDVAETIAIAELAIALAYSIQREPDPLACLAETVAGFAAIRPLSEPEQACLPGLIWMRLATTVIMAARGARLNPDNVYMQFNAEPAWGAMEQLAEVGGRRLFLAIRGACGGK